VLDQDSARKKGRVSNVERITGHSWVLRNGGVLGLCHGTPGRPHNQIGAPFYLILADTTNMQADRLGDGIVLTTPSITRSLLLSDVWLAVPFERHV
jgi:hypothetical protein